MLRRAGGDRDSSTKPRRETERQRGAASFLCPCPSECPLDIGPAISGIVVRSLTGQCESQAGYPTTSAAGQVTIAPGRGQWGSALQTVVPLSVRVAQLPNGDNAEAEHEVSAASARIWVNPFPSCETNSISLSEWRVLLVRQHGAPLALSWTEAPLRHERLLLLIAVIALGSIIGFAAGQLVTVFWSNAHRTSPARSTLTPR